MTNEKGIFAYTLFCEDIRNELDGRVSLVGVWGHSINIPPNSMLPKLGVHTVVEIEKSAPPSEVEFRLVLPLGPDLPPHTVTSDMIKSLIKQTEAETHIPVVQLRITAVLGNVMVPSSAVLTAITRIDQQEITSGKLWINVVDPPAP